MAYCKNCGGQLNDGASYCLKCGASADTYSNYYNAYQQPVVQAQQNNVTTVGGWIGWMILCSFLPLLGQIIMLCCSNDKSVKNYAKATFILCLIGVILMVIVILAMTMLGASLS